MTENTGLYQTPKIATKDSVSTEVIAVPAATTNNYKEIGSTAMLKQLYFCGDKWDSKTLNAIEVEGAGCLVQFVTRKGENVSESTTFIPGVRLVEDSNGGYRLRAIT